MSVNEFYKIDLSDGTAAQLLDICRYASCTEAIIRCAAVIDTPLPAGADDTQANALLLLQSEAISNSAVNHGWKVTDSQHVSDKDSGKRYLRTVLTPAGLPLAILPEAPQEAQVRLETAARKVITGEPTPCDPWSAPLAPALTSPTPPMNCSFLPCSPCCKLSCKCTRRTSLQ